MRRALAVRAVALASVLAAASCSTQDSPGGQGTAGGISTGFGVTSSEITLGALTDHSGPFAELGRGAVQGTQIWINETNAAGGICQRKVVLQVRDHGYDADKAKNHFSELEPLVLGFAHILGASVNTALSQDLIDNETTAVALSQSSEVLDNPYVIIPGATYDIEMINGLSYLMEQGRIRNGDTIGHIWIEGAYGANGLRGTRYFAQRHRLAVREAMVSSTTKDLRGIMAGFAGDQRVRAIALTTTPEQTAAAAVDNQQLRLNVPMVGNNPVFTPGLLNSPVANALGTLTVVASSAPFSSDMSEAQQVAQAYQQGGYQGPPHSGVTYGYAIGKIWGQLLRRACHNGDITRAGIQEALRQNTGITTDRLIADLDLTKPGAPAARQVYAGVPDAAVPGGIRQVKPLFAAPDALSYVAPHQGNN